MANCVQIKIKVANFHVISPERFHLRMQNKPKTLRHNPLETATEVMSYCCMPWGWGL